MEGGNERVEVSPAGARLGRDLPRSSKTDTLGETHIMRTNPFPGMNPFLERHWSDVHTKLIAYIADALAEQLPPEDAEWVAAQVESARSDGGAE